MFNRGCTPVPVCHVYEKDLRSCRVLLEEHGIATKQEIFQRGQEHPFFPAPDEEVIYTILCPGKAPAGCREDSFPRPRWTMKPNFQQTSKYWRRYIRGQTDPEILSRIEESLTAQKEEIDKKAELGKQDLEWLRKKLADQKEINDAVEQARQEGDDADTN